MDYFGQMEVAYGGMGKFNSLKIVGSAKEFADIDVKERSVNVGQAVDINISGKERFVSKPYVKVTAS